MKKSALRRHSPLKRGKPLQARGRSLRSRGKKFDAKWRRQFHSPERVAFVKGLRCSACGVLGYAENAHVGKKGKGAGRRADYDQIAPLCGDRPGAGVPGCHTLFDEYRSTFDEIFPNYDPAHEAAETERLWQLYQEGQR